MKPTVYSGRHYSEILSGKYKAYYGENKTDETSGEWVFYLEKNGKEVFRATNSELLEVSGGEGPKDMLIAGIALYLSTK